MIDRRGVATNKDDASDLGGAAAMTFAAALALLAATFVTSAISGVFGMAGGLLLMGLLALLLPVSAAFVAHGFIQFVANGWRAVIHRKHIDWRILLGHVAGALLAGLLVVSVAFVPSRPLLYLFLGLVPALVWLPKRVLHLDVSRPVPAILSGFANTALNLVAGVSGPLLDVFFQRASLGRHGIVATKAAVQSVSHVAKIVVYGAALAGSAAAGLLSWWVLALAVPCSMTGTTLGGRILDRLTDTSFLASTRWIVTAIGAAYLIQAARLGLGG
jgi:uncharacterized protein